MKKGNSRRKEREKRGNQSDYRAKGPAGGHYFFGWNENVCQCRNTCFLSAVFKTDKREILVEGEVYLDVAKDPSRPFIVKTEQL